MRAFLGASLVFLVATTTYGQFANSPALKGKPPEDPPKAAEDPAAAPVNAANPNAAGQAGSANSLFAALDTDGDGVISKVELRKAIASLKKLDTDNDGNITLAECGGAAANTPGAPVAGPANDATQWLDRIMAKDKNNDGKLTPDELTENERQMLQGADLNRDGAIDRQELATMGQGGGAQQPGNAVGATNGVGNAGRRGGNEAMGRFFQYDRNHDGKLTADEVPAQAAGMLKGGDLNGDGAIDAGELQALSARMGDRMKAWGTGADPTANGNAANAANANDPRNRRRPPARN